jgi:PTS system mannose-specific IIA component
LKRTILIASHHQLAAGMADTLQYITHVDLTVDVVTAYMDNTPVDAQIDSALSHIADENELFIFTDIMAGSVNQGFIKYLDRPHTHLITGMNLPVIMGVALNYQENYLSEDEVRKLVNEGKDALQYIDKQMLTMSDDDE